jgi:hypothetical protein
MHYHLKNLEVLNLDTKLRNIVRVLYEKYGLCVITSAYRHGDTGVHGTQPLRGIDLRVRDDQLGVIVANYVNVRYRYDSARPDKKVAKYHDIGQGAHLHLQVHPNTIEIRIEEGGAP